MTKLWQKDWKLDRAIEDFETRDDLVLDGHLVRSDIVGSLAHAYGLAKIGILSPEDLLITRKGLLEILSAWEKGKYVLSFGDEDIHTKIENTLTKRHGTVGKRIHTGRSRNDQVATAIRLYTKDQLHDIWQALLMIVYNFLNFAKKYEDTAMPGYTHMQKAMPSSVGMWAGSFAEGLLDSIQVVKTAYSLNDQSPLGSAAGYGVPIPHDREYTAKLMGFSRVQNNSLYCQNARGIIEAQVVSSLIPVLQLLNKFASDVLLFTTIHFDMFNVDDELCSGSSIMPQKRNIDIAELVRSKVHIVLGHYTQLIGISSNLTSGYNRDIQDTKKPLFESLWITRSTLVAANRLLLGVTPNKTKLRLSMTPEIYAAHRAFGQVMQGKSFRDAYHAEGSGRYESSLEKDSVAEVLRLARHKGATGNLGLHNIAIDAEKEARIHRKITVSYDTIIARLLSGNITPKLA